MSTADDHTQTDVYLDETDQLWQQLAGRLEEFVEAWENDADPPGVREFLPNSPANLRRLALVELIKVDLDYRWQKYQHGPLVEDYLVDFSELEHDGQLPVDLVYEEFHIRRRNGHAVEPDEYFRRFPEQQTQLRRLLGIESPEVSTALFAASRPDDVRAGEKLDDFSLLTQLGKGAFANVFLARQESMQRLVALKVSADQGTEPQTLAQLDHPHIVRVYDQRVVADRRLRLLYMKYVAGGTLQEAIEWSKQYPREQLQGAALVEAVDQALDRRGESPPVGSAARQALKKSNWWKAVCRLSADLAAALQYAHDRGVLHRDLKPANILLTADAAPQLVDFNISFCSKIDGVTPATYFGGSLAYMSPEQLEACNPNHDRPPESLSGQSDVYSLGVVLWELLTGERPFRDKQIQGNWTGTLEGMIDRRQRGPNFDLLQESSLACPPALRSVLARCLAADINKRYANAAELAADLELCLHPEAEQLLRPAKDSRAYWLRMHPVLVFVVAFLAPNLFSAWFNYDYNFKQIVLRLNAESFDAFWSVVLVVNLTLFPLGTILVLSMAWPIFRAVKRGPPADADRRKQLRIRALRITHRSVLICVCLWLVAGIAFPLSMHMLGAPMATMDYVHFVSSMTMCGIIAAVYPFFGGTTFAVHVMYPALVESPRDCADDESALAWTERTSWYYFALGFLLPMLGVVMLVSMSGDNRFSLAVLSAGSLAGCVLLFMLARRLQRDLATIAELAQLGRGQQG
ncbi:MAG: serine/threonine protein kinase [Pirellulales bacterium]|nr:serine/threonine protein kinase [Pirellulales bacterium]